MQGVHAEYYSDIAAPRDIVAVPSIRDEEQGDDHCLLDVTQRSRDKKTFPPSTEMPELRIDITGI
jgi:aspartate oxidase